MPKQWTPTEPEKTETPVAAPEPVAPAPAAPTIEDRLDRLTQIVTSLTEVVVHQATQAPDIEKLTNVMASGVAEANMKARQWWDESTYPEISAFNPKGERLHPRPEFAREIFLLGHLCQKEQHTAEEIEALNQLEAGEYALRDDRGRVVREQFVKVIPKNPGIKTSPLVVSWPCQSEQDRLLVARYDRGRGIVDFLQLSALYREPVAAAV